MKFVHTLKNNPDLLKVIEIFKKPDITPEAVVDAGNRFLVALYGYPISASYTPSLIMFATIVTSSFNKSSNMASLPPTEAAAHQHSLRCPLHLTLSCKCKKGCTGNCSCMKARLFCSVLCLHCWDNCNNRKIQVINSYEDDDDEPILADHLVEESLSLHVEEDIDDFPKDIGP
ncbi:hypothetical protein AVEN_253123-1 [Araneus ventricosus]|uniref:Tesmin/TSO1-like CXC domain-containing protein n=1 Tax=Araneus ventricosus TaxID=182803 RepID=A0A4Y2HEC9_ARAVE|nr:hypothetical protein AVEN_253123-1 [Araneus ventricosus]